MRDTRRTRLVLGLLVIAALALITISYRDSSASPIRSLRSFGSSAFGGLERAAAAVAHPVAGFFGGSSDSSRLTALEKLDAQLRAELSKDRLDKADVAQLRKLLGIDGVLGYKIIAANVIAAAPGYGNTVTLDAGAADGIRAGDTVLNGEGLVGHVVSVGTSTSTVQLVTDAAATVGAQLASGGPAGKLTGSGVPGSDLLQLSLLASAVNVRTGQEVVTFGSVGGRPFVGDIPIGVITKVEPAGNSLSTDALVRPYVSFSSLGVVGVVIVPSQTPPRHPLVPPAPTPRPTPTVTVTVTPSSSASASPGGQQPSVLGTPTPGAGG